VPETCATEVEKGLEKLQRHKSSGIDRIPAKFIKTGGRTIHFEIHKFINSIRNKKELPEEWKESIIVPIYENGDKTHCINYRRTSLW
jgi:hypothetical protein